ncbi:MAG: MG2 domain-containing protein [Pseudomonadota bacterium]
MTLFRGAFLGAMFALATSAAYGTPSLSTFGPTGSVRAVRQIHMTFSAEVVALGESKAAQAATVQCQGTPEQPKGRWLDGRRWVAEFARELPDGVVCKVQPLAAPAKAWRFDTGGPRLERTVPDSPTVSERQVVGFFSSAPVDPATLRYLRCSVDGKNAAVELLDAAASKAAAIKLNGYAVPGNQVYARCGAAPLPNYASVAWTWDKRIATLTGLGNVQNTVTAFQVAAPFTATASCKQLLGTPGCDRRQPVTVRFSAPLSAALASTLVMRDSEGKLFADKHFTLYPGQTTDFLDFRLDQASGSVTPQWPDMLVDLEGRALANAAQLRRPLRMASAPAYAGMERSEGVLEWHPGMAAAWPLVARGGDKTIRARSWRFGADTASTTLLALHAATRHIAEDPTASTYGPVPRVPTAYFQSQAMLAALKTPLPAPQDQTIGPAPLETGLMRIALSGLGNWLVEADSPAQRAVLAAQHKELARRQHQRWDVTIRHGKHDDLLWNGTPVARGPALARKLRALGPGAAVRVDPGQVYLSGEFGDVLDLADQMGLSIEQPYLLDQLTRELDVAWQNSRTALVQLTNLHVHATLSERGDSLIWITALDSGRPLADARVEVWAGDGEFRQLVSATSDVQGRVVVANRAWVKKEGAEEETRWLVVRLGADVAVSRVDGNVTAPYDGNIAVHTVLDRALFHPGETVSMAHVLRRPAASGWDVPPDPELTLQIWHGDVGTPAYEQKLAWRADGTSASSWTMPPGARLGTYHYALRHAENGNIAHGAFQVEEFRLPAFDASLALHTAWQGERQVVRVAPGLSFLAGGAAAGHAMTINGKYTAGATAPGYPAYSFFDLEMDRDAVTALPATALKLDAQGRAQAELAAPKVAWPMTLTAEMQFIDPNGETQTHAASVAVWPQRHKLGVTVRQSVAAGTVKVQVVALDEHDAPLAGASVTVDGAEFSTNWGHILPIAELDRLPVCTIKTGSDGRGECELAWRHGFRKAGWLFRARAAAMSSASTPLYYFAPKESAKVVLERAGAAAPSAGQEDRLRVRAPFLPATLLLTVEREGVLASQVHYLTEAVEEIALPTASHYAPGVSVVARFSRGSSQLPHDAPADSQLQHTERIALMFDPAGKRLDVTVAPALAEARPGARVAVKLSVRLPDGKPAAGASLTLIAVDDALALLKPNTTTLLFEHFWRSRGHDTMAVDLFQWWRWQPFTALPGDYMPAAESAIMTYGPPSRANNPFQALQGRGVLQMPMMAPSPSPSPVSSAPAVGSDGALVIPRSAPAPAAPPRVNFSTLALWQARVELDEHGEASVAVPLPDSLTRWRIVAIASAGTDMYGNGEAVIATSKPFEILPGLALSLRGADLVHQQLTLRNLSKASASVSLSARASVIAHPDQAQQDELVHVQAVTLAAGESRVLSWPVKVPDGAVALAWQFALTDAASGAVLDALDVRQAVVLQAPLTVRDSTLLALANSKSLAVAPPVDALPALGAIVVRWQESLAAGAIKGARAWMREYPFGCFEQRSSVAAALGDRSRWDQVMASLPRHLDHGLVRYFPETKGSEMLTAYVLSLSRAYSLPIPQQDKVAMQDALRGRMSGQATNDWLPDAGALNLRLAMQAALGADLDGVAPAVPPELDLLPTEALLDWISYVLDTPASAQRATRLKQAASQLRNRYDMHGGHLAWRTGNLMNRWWLMWSDDAVSARTALVLQRWQAIDPIWRDELALLPQAIADQQKRGSWSTTVGNAYSIAALQSFMLRSEQGPVSGVSSAALGGQTRSSAWPDAASVHLPLPRGANATLQLEHKGSGAPWASVSVLAAAKPGAPVVHGLSVEKTVTAVQRKVAGQWSVGDVIKVTLTMRSDADLGWVVVHDPIPSGATILGKGLAREGLLVQAEHGRPSWWQPGSIERASDSFRGYYERIWTGSWSTDYLVRLNHAGQFGLPATRIEAMYAPEIFGETPNEALEVAP